MKDEIFEKTLQFILRYEGGYVNDPYDLGGETNCGITYSTYNAYRKSKNLPVQSVKYITDEEIRDIYYNNYYKASGADKVTNPVLAAYTFDTAVNMGVSRAKSILEQSNGNPNIFYDLRKAKYDEFVKYRPEQKRFLQGWYNRISSMKQFAENNFSQKSFDTTNNQGNNTNIFQISIEENVDRNGNHIFTPEEIGNLSPKEFEKYWPVIEQQLKEGLIKPHLPRQNFSGYTNPATGSNKLYSREDIGAMSTKEYLDFEDEIMAQMQSIGIPTNNELYNASRSGETIYVESYVRRDGTRVRGYYRSV